MFLVSRMEVRPALAPHPPYPQGVPMAVLDRSVTGSLLTRMIEVFLALGGVGREGSLLLGEWSRRRPEL